MTCQTYRMAHLYVKLVMEETFVDGAAAGPHTWTESLTVVATSQIQLPVLVVVVGLEFGNPQNLQLALGGQICDLVGKTGQRRPLIV